MTNELLTEDEAGILVEDYMVKEEETFSIQEILSSGEIPRLEEYILKPGKVSDSIFGGEDSYFDKSTGNEVEFENPPLNTIDGIPLRIMIRTERISTHDIPRGEIPFKDQIISANHNHMRRMLTGVLGDSQFEVDGLNDNSVVMAAEDLEQIPFENILRAYMAKSSTSTSLYQHFIRGKRKFCGHKLPDDLIPNGKLSYVMDTPSTKSDEHDEPVSPRYLFENNICDPREYLEIRNNSLAAFGMASQFLREKGIILCDGKTEHGVNHLGKIVVQDEVYTMDSSRFWLKNDYDQQLERLKCGEIEELNPKSLSKEFARGFSEGNEKYTAEQRAQIAVRYIQGIQYLIGKRFKPDLRPKRERVISELEKVVNQLVDY